MSQKDPHKSGTDPETLTVQPGTKWEDLVKKAATVPKPESGWPDRDVKPRKKRRKPKRK